MHINDLQGSWHIIKLLINDCNFIVILLSRDHHAVSQGLCVIKLFHCSIELGNPQPFKTPCEHLDQGLPLCPQQPPTPLEKACNLQHGCAPGLYLEVICLELNTYFPIERMPLKSWWGSQVTGNTHWVGKVAENWHICNAKE